MKKQKLLLVFILIHFILNDSSNLELFAKFIVIFIILSTFYSNISGQIQSIAINFNDGNGYTTIPFNQNIAVSYTNAGIKTWTYKLTLTNNNILYGHSKIDIKKGFKTKPWSQRHSQQ